MNQTPPPPPLWVLLTGSTVLGLVALTMLALGLHLTGLWRRRRARAEVAPVEDQANDPPLTFQFGLRAIFFLTTGVAVYVMVDKLMGWQIGRTMLSSICLVLSLSVPAGWMLVLLMLITGGMDNARRSVGIMFLISGAGVLLATASLVLMNFRQH